MHDTALIGLGKIASTYSSDQEMQKTLNYYTHAQVLDEHEKFNWISAVDPSSSAQANAKEIWGEKEYVGSVRDLKDRERYEVIVLATPPENRLQIIEEFPSLKGVIVEKPLGYSYKSSLMFIEECNKKGIQVQVNLTRRADTKMRYFSEGELNKKIGSIQFVFGTYGRGLHNYGTHLIDLTRMLIGEIACVSCISSHEKQELGPIKDDLNLSFVMKTDKDIQIIMHPLDFSFYREGSLDIWGERGRIEIVQEGLKFIESPLNKCRSLEKANEISSDKRIMDDTGYSDALYNLYTNLSLTILNNSELHSSGESALITESIIESIFLSYMEGGREISCKNL